MGKRLIQQRRGRGTITYRSPGHRFKGPVKLPSDKGEVMELVNCPGHSAPLAYIQTPDKNIDLVIAPLGTKKGDQIQMGPKSEIKSGNVLHLKDIPEGTSVYNIESQPGDGGKFVRASGTFAKVVAKNASKITIKLPSKKEKS